MEYREILAICKARGESETLREYGLDVLGTDDRTYSSTALIIYLHERIKKLEQLTES